MKIAEVKSLVFPEVKIIRFGRFPDERGFFTETYKHSDFQNISELSFIKDISFLQTNVSYSKKNVIRGLHFQHNPLQGKLIRTMVGHMIDLFLDIRVGSPHFGQIAAQDMPGEPDQDYDQWIWIPPGFAHGFVALKETYIEYFCTAEYGPGGEAAISPFASDIDWSMCDSQLKTVVDSVITDPIISDKDKNAHTLSSWKANPNSSRFSI